MLSCCSRPALQTSLAPAGHAAPPAVAPTAWQAMSMPPPSAALLAMAPPPLLPMPAGPPPSAAAAAQPSQPLDRVTARGITVTMADVARVAPVVTFHPKERHFPCGIEALLAGACLQGAQGQALVRNPTSWDLGRHASPDHRLWLDARHAAGGEPPAGNRVVAPMYVVVQVPEDRSYVDIRYLLLFAYQGAQVVRVLVPGQDFDAFLPHFGEHQGDIENVCVRLTPDLKTVTHVTFEQHGKPKMHPAHEVVFVDGHPVARCSLEDHATYNAYGLPDDACIEHAEEARKPIPGFGVSFIDLLSARGARWAPHEAHGPDAEPFVFVGLDKSGQPINQQYWSGFAGMLGGRWRNDFAGAQGIDKALSWMQRTYVNNVVKVVVASGKLEERRRESNGTPGLGGRSWMTMEPSADAI